VDDANVVIVDDIVDSGETVAYIANKVKKEGANRVFVIASHGVFTETAMDTLDRSPIEKVIVTNSLPPVSSISNKVVQVSIAPLLARAIWAEHFKSRKVDEDYLIEFH
jgi:ribose-phosphate pyrophosphokinase